MTIEFQEWPKISRLFREVIISEKIDGTNAAIGIKTFADASPVDVDFVQPVRDYDDQGHAVVYAQSRTRLINPDQDNFGFAKWVWDNADALAHTLGLGLHFGEWWGSGIQRGYGLQKGEKRFSLFNTPRYGDKDKFDLTKVPGLGIVPVLYRGMFSTWQVEFELKGLREHGSRAVPGFMNPEGVVTFHTAANLAFKTTLDKDEQPKGINS